MTNGRAFYLFYFHYLQQKKNYPNRWSLGLSDFPSRLRPSGKSNFPRDLPRANYYRQLLRILHSLSHIYNYSQALFQRQYFSLSKVWSLCLIWHFSMSYKIDTKKKLLFFLVLSFENTWLNQFFHGLVHDLWYCFFVLTFLYKTFKFSLKKLIWAFTLNFKNYPPVDVTRVDFAIYWPIWFCLCNKGGVENMSTDTMCGKTEGYPGEYCS